MVCTTLRMEVTLCTVCNTSGCSSVHISLCSSLEGLDVRLGFDLCVEEQDFLRKRKKVVAEALKKFLYLEQDLQEHEVYCMGACEVEFPG